MKKINFLLTIVVGCFINNAIAESKNGQTGYVVSAYGTVLKTAYGSCVHTAYYSPEVDGREECGDAKPKPQPVATPKPKVVIETVTMSDADKVLFNFDASTLTLDGEKALNDIITKIDGQSDVTKITIDGYTDALGKADYNMKLSKDRADSVKSFFIKHKYPEDKIIANGHGENEAKVSAECFKQYGPDNIDQIWVAQSKLANKKFKAKKLNKHLAKEKKQLQQQLAELQNKRNKLVKCAAADRKVVFTIEHTEQVKKTIMVPASAPVASAPLAVPPISSGE